MQFVAPYRMVVRGRRRVWLCQTGSTHSMPNTQGPLPQTSTMAYRTEQMLIRSLLYGREECGVRCKKNFQEV